MKKDFAGKLVLLSWVFFIPLSLFFTASCSAQGGAGLIAHWKFDEGKGNKLIDYSGNHNDGIIHGPRWTKGRVGGGLEFDGKDDYIEIPKSPSIDSIKDQFTVLFWMKSPLEGRYSIIERWFYGPGVDQRSLEMDISSGKSISWLASTDGASGASGVFSKKVPANEWVFIAVVCDGKKVRSYINGDCDPSVFPAPGKLFVPNTPLHIGGWYAADVSKAAWYNLFKGVLDEMRIYSRGLTQQEILEIYKKTSPLGTVAGKVIDVNAKPVVGAKVSVGLFTTTTDDKGFYKIAVPVKMYEITASKKGYARCTISRVKVKPGKTTNANILLSADNDPPGISNLSIKDVASVTAEVSWETDEPCIGAVKIGTSSGKYNKVVKESSYGESHKVLLTGLRPATTHYIVIESIDGAENVTKSKELTFKTQKLSDVVLWDTGEIYRVKHTDLRQYKNRANWKQVPYGAGKDFKFKGAAVLENKYLFLYFDYNNKDAIFMYPKLDGKPAFSNELYKRPGRGHGTSYAKVIKCSYDEIIVEHKADDGDNACVSLHRMVPNKPWIEFRAVKVIKTQGIHGKTRIDIVPIEGGNDYVIDSLRFPKAYYHPARKVKESKMVLCLHESIKYPFMWVFTFPSLQRADPYITCDSGHGPRTDAFTWYAGKVTIPKHWFSEPNWPKRSWGCIASTHAHFGKDSTEPVVLGALPFWRGWNREELGIPVKAGEVYKSNWKPPFPGHWRMTIRIAEKKYTMGWKYDGKTRFKAKYYSKDVYDGNFSFKIPEDGILDYVLMYIYDRTKETPPEVFTPMDQYRWMMKTSLPIGGR